MSLHQRIIDGLREMFISAMSASTTAADAHSAARSDPVNERALALIQGEIANSINQGEMAKVVFSRGKLSIVKGVQSLALAYDADTNEEWDWYQETTTKVLHTLLPAKIEIGEPVAYADPMAFNSFKGNCTKEWMWQKPDAGLVPLYCKPPSDRALAVAIEKRICELDKVGGEDSRVIAQELYNIRLSGLNGENWACLNKQIQQNR